MGFFDSLFDAARQASEHKERAERMTNQELVDAYRSSNDKWEKAALRYEAEERVERSKKNQ